jgi:putative transposase
MGTPKSCTIKRTPTGKWYATIDCDDVPGETIPTSDSQAGIDLGISAFATLSNGERIANPRFFKQEEKALAKVNRRFAKQPKGSPNRLKARKVVSKVHERIKNKRHNFVHQTTRQIVNAHGTICIEDLKVHKMIEGSKFPKMSKSIADVAWGEFISVLSYKAASAGRIVVKVNPAYTSQDCSRCNSRHKFDLNVRVYKCPTCGLEIDRDLNASINILRVGLHSLGRKAMIACA